MRFLCKDYPKAKDLRVAVSEDIAKAAERMKEVPCMLCNGESEMLLYYPANGLAAMKLEVPPGKNRVYYYNLCQSCDRFELQIPMCDCILMEKEARARSAMDVLPGLH